MTEPEQPAAASIIGKALPLASRNFLTPRRDDLWFTEHSWEANGMMVLDVMFCVLAVLAGMLGGWLLRAFFRSGWIAARTATRRLAPRPNREPACSATLRKGNDGDAAAPCVRNTFALALGHRLAESTRRGDALSLILARIDGHESLNERHGLPASNEIIEAAGKFFLASVRAMDWVARFDAATFAFLLPNTKHSDALIVAERLRKNSASAGPSVGNGSVRLTLSLGTTEFVLGDTSEAILRRAEDAMNASLRRRKLHPLPRRRATRTGGRGVGPA